jgi:hypothetical protein
MRQVALSENFKDDGIPQFLLRERASAQVEDQPCNPIAASLVTVWGRARRLTALIFGYEDETMRNGTDAREDLSSEIAHQRQGQRVLQPVDAGGIGIPQALHKALDGFRAVEGERAMHSLLCALIEQSADRLRAHGVAVSTSADTEALRGKLKEAAGAANYYKAKYEELAGQGQQHGEPGMGQVN